MCVYNMMYIEMFVRKFEGQWTLEYRPQRQNNACTVTRSLNTLNSAYNEVAFNEKSVITKENLRTKYFPFTYNDVALKRKATYNEGKSQHIFSLQAELSVAKAFLD